MEEEEESILFDENDVSATVEWAVWHLTSRGWVRGSYKNEIQGSNDISIPKDRFMTCLYKECLGKEWKAETDETYREKNKEKEISKLLKKYGPSPREL